MAIRDRWNRMRSATTSSATYKSPPASPGASPVSAPASPGVWATITGFSWSSRSNTASSSTSTKTSTSSADHQRRNTQQQPRSPQHQQQQQQSPRARITFTLPSRPSLKRPAMVGRRSRTHPLERPLTEENLRYQEVFANYALTFGSNRCSSDGEISPCCSRRGSLDIPPA
ncbi:hypothetical protein MAPG_03014 [Magnaporthiopsis poae ATCC 64411]|uniref:Uncharacterized protein n=1 Tax=Magnaporthiopsis poae (strain ATCC 64411 / 73-15) TaxID=644358 RepID=A0A0C4DSX0_MAGP6|nr:hypothetical protein MAPG_03014 [Magnaporthiopsis poae ATCC 64411]